VKMTVQLRNGVELPFAQAMELGHLLKRADPGTTHWHFNDCGCCVTLHGPDYAYVIGRDGESTLFPHRGCECGEVTK
jgi:hypothetical protein